MDTNERRYVVCGSRPWNRSAFDRLAACAPGRWSFAATPDELNVELSAGEPPAMLFFLHWSWHVPADVHTHFPCVVFHMTDVPYGRGGSPLQNLISRGHRSTVLSAIAMTDDVDAGPVYAKAPLSLDGSAEAVYLRADALAGDLIVQILTDGPEPQPQQGTVEVFTRRTSAMSEVPTDLPDLDAWHDFIRMLDAEGYPSAYVDHGPFRIHLRRASRYSGNVVADAFIQRRENDR